MKWFNYFFSKNVLFNMQKVCEGLGYFGWGLKFLSKWVNKKLEVSIGNTLLLAAWRRFLFWDE